MSEEKAMTVEDLIDILKTCDPKAIVLLYQEDCVVAYSLLNGLVNEANVEVLDPYWKSYRRSVGDGIKAVLFG